MFSEFLRVKQEAAGRRRWFEADGVELIVWYNDSGSVDGFQFCYDRELRTQALTWRSPAGFFHSRVRGLDSGPPWNDVPVLEPDGPVDWGKVCTLFRVHGASLEAPLRDLVATELAKGAMRVGKPRAR